MTVRRATRDTSGVTSATAADPSARVIVPGPVGPTGATGATGPGVASGGTTGQALTKASGVNYDTQWTSIVPRSGGTYTGKIGSPSFLLGSDMGLKPVVGGQSVLTAWWGIQLVGNQQADPDPDIYSPVNVGARDHASVVIPNQQAGSAGLAVWGAPSQTGNLQEWRDSSGAVLASITAAGNIQAQRVGFNGAAPVAKPTVTGSRGGNAALASLLTALASMGLITDGTTA